MNIKILLFAVSVAALSSCSSTYRNGQTPDDVYYSPARVVEEDVRQDTRRDEARRNDRVELEERQIRMAVYDRRWRDFDDDYNYSYNPYKYGYSYGYYYNPYYCYYPVYITNVIVSNPKNTVPRMTNLGSYNNNTYAISGTKYGTGVRPLNGTRAYNNSNNNNNGFIRRVLTSTTPTYNNSMNNSYNSTESNNTRSYTPSTNNSSTNSSSSGSSSGSSGTSVSRPGRGG